MKAVNFVFVFDMPYVLRDYNYTYIGSDHYYIDDVKTADLLKHYSELSYIPLLDRLERMLNRYGNSFSFGVVVNGITLDLFERYNPVLIERFRNLLNHESVELLMTGYSGGLCALYNETMWRYGINLYKNRVKNLFGVSPTSLFNSEMLYNDDVSSLSASVGCNVVMVENVKSVMSWQSPCDVYLSGAELPLGSKKRSRNKSQKLLVRQDVLSDFFTYRFSDRNYILTGLGQSSSRSLYYPFDAADLMSYLSESLVNSGVYNICLGAESFGIRQPQQSGIFDFLEALPQYAYDMQFVSPHKAADILSDKSVMLSIPYPTVWSGDSKDTNCFTGNDLQSEVINKLYGFAGNAFSNSDKNTLYDVLAVDSTKYFGRLNFSSADILGGSAYNKDQTVYEFFINYMNILSDLLYRIDSSY